MNSRTRLSIAIVIGFVAISVFIWLLSMMASKRRITATTEMANGQGSPDRPEPAIASPTPSTSILPEANASATPTDAAPSTSSAPSMNSSPVETSTPQTNVSPSGKLLIPVAGIRAAQLVDTFTAARSEGRVHDAIDIMAPKDTSVLAAADGKIVKLFQSNLGGTTIYELDPDNKTIYYYAHLDKYADGLTEGLIVHQGDTIAYVGDTGNAGPGNYHLHFSISIVTDPKRYWDGTNINPYPLLTGKQ